MLTGASTPLGVALIDALIASDDVDLVLALGREDDAPRPTSERLRYRRADLERPRVMHDVLWGAAHDLGIDTVVHGMHHRRPGDRGQRVHVQNVEATRELVLGCREHSSIRRFIYRSFAEVYALRHVTSDLIDENQPLDFDPGAEQWVRDRVEADLTVCAQLGGSTQIAVMRLAEILAPAMGSQLWDYLQSRVCLRPLGFDPMINVLAVADAVAALLLAMRSERTGVFNIPGRDTLPLSAVILESHRADIPVPGPLIAPLYGLRRQLAGFDFRYEMNLRKFHFGGVLDGTRARDLLGYVPAHHARWPQPWWQTLFARLAGTSDEAS
jgi:UDP-glucose 4-epimerase